ncbi:hypothetical protein ACFQPA_11620 [Halomarina halobia]|uniref:Cox cluster protein n=1 Tax=Halomarina halobia TaxID=3033386 RepID=A0ABD6AA73_9EURY|nr:hypothetical protein [Halomarina sp. PSR21]
MDDVDDVDDDSPPGSLGRDDDIGHASEPRNVPERPGTAAFAAALKVRRNAKFGAIAGFLVAALVYAVRVFELLGPVPGTGPGPLLFLALAFVLGVGVALLVALALTVVSASRAARRL